MEVAKNCHFWSGQGTSQESDRSSSQSRRHDLHPLHQPRKSGLVEIVSWVKYFRVLTVKRYILFSTSNYLPTYLWWLATLLTWLNSFRVRILVRRKQFENLSSFYLSDVYKKVLNIGVTPGSIPSYCFLKINFFYFQFSASQFTWQIWQTNNSIESNKSNRIMNKA